VSLPIDVAMVVDTGVDDALALLLALRSPGLRLRAIACVAGNVEVDQVMANTLRVLDVADAGDVPLGRGTAPGPGGRSVHGADGMADLGLPASTRHPSTLSIAEVLDLDEPYTLLSLAPCTDLTTALSPRVAEIAAVAGFNRDHDPVAFDAVVGSGGPPIVYERSVWEQARVSRDDAEQLAHSTDQAASLAGRLLHHQVQRGGGASGSIGDAVAVAALLMGSVGDPDPGAWASSLLAAFAS
jgi:pyrimidine-specific ribonucleoside hydrolase